jgi:hypothetical protein
VGPVLVVVTYESMFGNTCAVAEAIAEGVAQAPAGRRHAPEVRCLPVIHCARTLFARADLVVVGAPTHYSGVPSRRSIIVGRQGQRRAALLGGSATAELIAPLDDEDVDLRAWLRDLPPAPAGAGAAAFDTRLTSRWAGGASSGIARRLRRHGYRLLTTPEGFVVDTPAGPPHEGELVRAHRWGSDLRRLL